MTAPVFTSDQVNALLLRGQHLSTPAQDADLTRTVEGIGGLHATSATVPYLSLRARRSGFVKEELQEALYDERSLGKVLCMRNTLFILPKELLPTVYQATRKQREALIDRWLRYHDIPRQEYERALDIVRGVVGNAAKTASEIKQELDDPSLAMLVDLMPTDWQLMRGRPRGTWRSNLHEYSPIEVWFADVDLESLTMEEAQVSLVQYYLSRMGPATEKDIVWWTGLGKTQIRQALAEMEQQLMAIEIEDLGQGYLMLSRDMEVLGGLGQIESGINLLPALDPYVMGYKDRRRFLTAERYDQVFDRAGNALPTVWLDGEVIGVWLENREGSMFEVLLFEEADKRVLTELEAEAECVARFMEHEPPIVRMELYPEGAYPKTPFSLART